MAHYDPRFLPICKEDLDELGWDYVDVIIVSADAYVDHPCFGHAVVGRLFEHEGLRVAILPQPNWRDLSLSFSNTSINISSTILLAALLPTSSSSTKHQKS